ncbi:MAG: glycerophosphodiester phosphodiesterase [Microthrixaceae bacterium]
MSSSEPVLICAHRGASGAHPDNTLPAFHGAREEGADWVELDVRLTRDGALVVHHDPWYADGRGVWATPADQRPEQVVLLADALDACAGMGVNVEIKNSPGDLGGDEVPHDLEVCDLVVTLVAGRGVADAELGRVAQPIQISSFDEATLARVRGLEPRLATAHLVFDVSADPELLDRTATAGDAAVNPWDPFVDEAFMERCRELGLGVKPWTVDDPERIVQLARLGVTSIITNQPALARATLVDAGLL